MVSMAPPVNVNRIKLYEKTPNMVEDTGNELNPIEPALDLCIPDPDKATVAGVLGASLNDETVKEWPEQTLHFFNASRVDIGKITRRC